MDEKVDVREAAGKRDARSAKGAPPDSEWSQDARPQDGRSEADTSRDDRVERMGRMLDPAVLGGLTIDVVAQLGRGTMTIDELAGLASGEVVRLDTPLNGVVDLTLNGALVARGEIVAVDDQFGVRVTEILVRPQ